MPCNVKNVILSSPTFPKSTLNISQNIIFLEIVHYNFFQDFGINFINIGSKSYPPLIINVEDRTTLM
jgi:hypothetical protein